MKKVAIIGAGNVGGTTAARIAESGLAQVVLLDVVENIALAKAFDMEDARYSLGSLTRLEGSGDMSLMSGSDIVVVTAGLPRKPGMTREDLLAKNARIMTDVCAEIVRHAKDALIIVVSNPLDVLTYLAFKRCGFDRKRVFGMGASLDSSRFANLVSKKVFIDTQFIRALVVGCHGESMVPLPSQTLVRGKALTDLLKKDEVEELVEATKQRGAQIVSLYGSGSAYYAPSAAVYEIVKTIIAGPAKEIPVSVVLSGEYGLKDLAIGVLAKIGPGGMEEIIELKLTAAEKKLFEQSARSIKESIKSLKL